MSPRVTLRVEEERVDVDGVEQEGGAADPDYLDLNYASLCLTVAVSMAHM